MIAYLWGEVGADTVENLLVNSDEQCMAHALNVCEVYYKARRFADEREVRTAVQDLKGQGLVVREDLDEPFWMTVAGCKTHLPSVPLADCFVAALASRVGAWVVTADHPDFEQLEAAGLCAVRFIR